MGMETKFLLRRDGLEIPCKCSEPEDGDIRRIVVGVHGIGGSKDDAIQASLAEEMEQFYSVVFRFDFPAHGENLRDGSVMSLDGCVKTLVAVAAEARQRYPDVEDLCLFASGFGAYVTLVALEELMALPGRVKLVVQTPSVRMDETILAMIGFTRETLWTMDQVAMKTRHPIGISYRFYEELRDHSVMHPYPIPILILHGEEDAFIRMQDVRQFRRLNERSKLVIIPGTSHRFLESGAWDMVLDLTRDWFQFEQVLLCDWE